MQLLTIAQVAEKLERSESRIKVWCDEGRIKVTQTLPSGVRLIAPRDAKRPKPKRPGPKTAGKRANTAD